MRQDRSAEEWAKVSRRAVKALVNRNFCPAARTQGVHPNASSGRAMGTEGSGDARTAQFKNMHPRGGPAVSGREVRVRPKEVAFPPIEIDAPHPHC